MKITELYKPQEITDFKQKFKQTYVPQWDDEDRERWVQSAAFDSLRSPYYDGPFAKFLNELMAKHGFEFVGAGGFGSVYSNDKYPYVLKVYLDASIAAEGGGYQQWIAACLQHQHNPYLPKIKGRPMRIIERVHAVRLEKLVELEDHTFSNDLRYDYESWVKGYSVPDVNEHIFEIFELIHGITNSSHVDLYANNVMQRPDGHPVVIDPIAG